MPPLPSDYIALKKALIAAGCFRYAPWRSMASLALHVAGAAALFVAAAHLPPWMAAPLVVCASSLFYRIGFVMHDAAHGAVFEADRHNRWFAMLAAAILGELASGWRHGHNLHHRAPNVRGQDMDYAHRWSPTRRCYGGLLRAYIELLVIARRGRWVLPQSLLLLMVRDAVYCYRHSRRRFPLELAACLTGLGAQVTLLCYLFGWAGLGLFFAHTLIGGLYLNTVFIGNHYDLPAFDPAEAAGLDFIELQVRTTRNYPDGTIAGFVLGGLQHQIEHHLFPRMPRYLLGKAAPWVRALCEARGLGYSCAPLRQSLVASLRYHLPQPRPL